jgi:predicted DNA binding CopG/RHH family protein
MEAKKRKTTTSSAVKNRYNAKVYTQVAVKLPKDLVAAFKEKCAAEGISQAQVIKQAIEAFLNQ